MCKNMLIIGMVLLLIVSLATGCGAKDSEATTAPIASASAVTPTPTVASDATDSSAPVETAAEFSKEDLLVELVGTEAGKTFVTITSKVTNTNSTHTFKKAVIRVVLVSSEGKALKAESAYPVDTDATLAPGESVEFSVLIAIPTTPYTDVEYVINSIR